MWKWRLVLMGGGCWGGWVEKKVESRVGDLPVRLSGPEPGRGPKCSLYQHSILGSSLLVASPGGLQHLTWINEETDLHISLSLSFSLSTAAFRHLIECCIVSLTFFSFTLSDSFHFLGPSCASFSSSFSFLSQASVTHVCVCV